MKYKTLSWRRFLVLVANLPATSSFSAFIQKKENKLNRIEEGGEE